VSRKIEFKIQDVTSEVGGGSITSRADAEHIREQILNGLSPQGYRLLTPGINGVLIECKSAVAYAWKEQDNGILGHLQVEQVNNSRDAPERSTGGKRDESDPGLSS
jgi:hypothetical protein